MTLKSEIWATQGDWKWHHSIDRIRVPIGVSMALYCIVCDI